MSTGEIFANPTVQQVIFELRFPNLFFLESKIGEYQLKIMDLFPNSQLVHHQRLWITPFQGSPIQNQPAGPEPPQTAQHEKIWRFQTSDNTTTLDIRTSSLHIVSEKYKTYDNEGSEEKFRDMLRYTVEPFLGLMSLPKILRIGLRYIDLCPWPEYSTLRFKEYYNSAFPVHRFSIEEMTVYDFAAIISKDQYKLRYAENLTIENDKPKYILDFDGSAEMVSAADWLKVTDDLHSLISCEYEKTIKEPIKEIMRKNPKEA